VLEGVVFDGHHLRRHAFFFEQPLRARIKLRRIQAGAQTGFERTRRVDLSIRAVGLLEVVNGDKYFHIDQLRDTSS
jgi:hypothetical protein